MERLGLNPISETLGVMRSKDAPSMYTAPFDNGLVNYQVLADHPVVWVAEIIWLNEGSSGG